MCGGCTCAVQGDRGGGEVGERKDKVSYSDHNKQNGGHALSSTWLEKRWWWWWRRLGMLWCLCFVWCGLLGVSREMLGGVRLQKKKEERKGQEKSATAATCQPPLRCLDMKGSVRGMRVVLSTTPHSKPQCSARSTPKERKGRAATNPASFTPTAQSEKPSSITKQFVKLASVLADTEMQHDVGGAWVSERSNAPYLSAAKAVAGDDMTQQTLTPMQLGMRILLERIEESLQIASVPARAASAVFIDAQCGNTITEAWVTSPPYSTELTQAMNAPHRQGGA